jgi:hypothetical protein
MAKIDFIYGFNHAVPKLWFNVLGKPGTVATAQGLYSLH